MAAWWNPFKRNQTQPPAVAPGQRQRSYAGARVSRLESDWITSSTSADAEIWSSLKLLRNRSRQLVRDNDYARGALRGIVNQTIGTGINLQSQIKMQRGNRLNEKLNALVEDTWKLWTRAEYCDVSGQLCFSDFERLCLRSVIESGEVLVRFHRQKFADSPVILALELIEADQLADDYMAGQTSADNYIRMGIEFNQYRRPVNYWIYPYHPGDIHSRPQGKHGPVPVPASEIIHLFVSDRPGQTRGVPWFHSCLQRMRQLGGYEEAELVAARAQAAVMGFVQTPDNDVYGQEDETGDRVDSLEPGTIKTLAPGETFSGFAPTRPGDSFDPFVRMMLRGMAAGLGLSYESISRDYSNTSYSSARVSLIEERDQYKVLQGWLTSNLHQPIFERWLEMAVLSGAVSLPGYDSAPRLFNQPRWCCRGWQWVDPQKEIAAAKEEIKAGLTTAGAVIAESGGDIEDVFRERRRELDLAKELELQFDTDIPEPQPQAAGASTDAGATPTPLDQLFPTDATPATTDTTPRAVATLIRALEDARDENIGLWLTEQERATGKKNCKNSKPCGNGCVAKTKNCKQNPPQPAPQALAVATQAPSTPKAKATKKTKAPTAGSPPATTPAAKTPKTTKAKGAAAATAATPPATKVALNQAELKKKRAALVSKYGEKTVLAAEANTKQLLADAAVFTKVPTSEITNLLLDNGFKTAHELGGRPGAPPPGSGGSNDYLDARARVEKKVMGIPTDTHGSDRPKYAYLGNAKDINTLDHLDVEGAYGGITVEYRKEVKDRTTFTGADSFKSGIASKVSDPNAASLVQLTSRGLDDKTKTGLEIGDQLRSAANAKNLSELAKGATITGNAYIEAQVHGKLGASDIAALHFKPSSVHDTPTPELIKKANEKGIDVYVNGKKVTADTYKPDLAPKTDLAKALREGDVDAVSKSLQELHLSGQKLKEAGVDSAQTELANRLGYGDKPKKLTSAEFDQQAKDSGLAIMYRGVKNTDAISAEEIQRRFVDGDYYTGAGIIGHGNYFASSAVIKNGALQPGSKDVAAIITAQDSAKDYAQDKGKIIRTMLAEDAKIAPSQRVIEMQKAFDAKIEAKIKEAQSKIDPEKYTDATAKEHNDKLSNFSKSYDDGIQVSAPAPRTKTKSEITVILDPKVAGIEADLENRNIKGYFKSSTEISYKIEKTTSKSGKEKYEIADTYKLPDAVRKRLTDDQVYGTYDSPEAAIAVLKTATKKATRTRYLRGDGVIDPLKDKVEMYKVKPGDITPKGELALRLAGTEYKILRKQLGDGWPDSVSSKFAMSQGIDVISFSRSDKVAARSDSWVNVLNRSKIIVDEKIYSPKEIGKTYVNK